jgi:predicted ATPase/class 3 adenylate cyclase
VAEERVDRRLAAILCADVAGYSRLMGADEEGTLAALKAHRREFIDPLIAQHQGRIVKTTGDGILIEFASVVDAVRCAVVLQQGMEDRNANSPTNSQIRFRVGINLGDIIVDQGDIFGDGVNVAARLQALAEPGEIYVSASVREQIGEKLPIAFVDRGEHNVKNIDRPVHVYRFEKHRESPGAVAESPKKTSQEAGPDDQVRYQKVLALRRNNLPAQLTSFVGRSDIIAVITRQLIAKRLVTLTGVGGSGKTRLALMVAEQMVSRYKDGVWLVELAGLSDASLIPQAVVSALGISEQPGLSVTASVSEYLRAKSLLLVMDNCEHVLAACSELVDKILATCPSVSILATTRESLGITGEVIIRVPPLTMPETDSAVSQQALMEFEAPRLFLDRAFNVQPEFQVTNANAPEIASICRRLDGLPLAIELAAARVKVLSVSQICSRLDDQFRLLTGRSRAALGRHQTLIAVIDWSFKLLSDAERALLRRLSVFAGGWTLESAETICSCAEVEKSEVLDLIEHLVDKSLVIAQTQADEARYHLLETVRQYGQAKLVEVEEARETRDLHLEYFTALAERAEPFLQGAQSVIWSQRLEAENDNIRAALQWSLSGGNSQIGLALAGALTYFWRSRGYVSEGSRWFEQLLSRTPEGSYFSRAKAYFGAGWLAWWKGADAKATELTEEALQTFRQLDDKWWIARSLQEIGFHSFARKEYARIELVTKEALALGRQLADKRVIGASLVQLAFLSEQVGDDTRAAQLFQECIAVRRQAGHKFGIANALRGLGRVSLRQGDHAGAAVCYMESLSLALEDGDFSIAAPSLEGLATLAITLGELARAARTIGAAEKLRAVIGVPPLAWERESYERSVETLSKGLSDEEFRSLRAEGGTMKIDQVVAPYEGQDRGGDHVRISQCYEDGS